MSDDLLTTIRLKVDAAGMDTGLTNAKRKIESLGKASKEITDKLDENLKKVGKDADISDSVKKATKAFYRDAAELGKQLILVGSTVQQEFKNINKSADELYVQLAGKGIKNDAINQYIELVTKAQTVAKEQAQTAAKAAEEQAAATQKLMAEEDHYADLKRQHAAFNKAIDDQRAKASREELALIESINDATLRMKTTGKAGTLPPTYYEAKAGAKPSSGVNDALAALKAEESQLKAIAKAEKDRADAAAKTAKDIKDQTAALEAFRVEVQNAELNLVHFGRAKTAAFLQDKGARLGFDPAMVQAELAALQKIEAANKAAFAAANPHITELAKRAEAAGTSVKGLTANLRNVPAQLTDIVISLQGGQAPLTVLLQQGGQLKDMFGGVGNAARALGGYVATLINPFSIAAAAVGTLGYAYYEGSKELDAYRKALILTGNTIGLTGGQMQDMARAMAAVGGTQSKASEALAEFVNAGAAGSGSLQKFTASAIAFEKATGTAVSETAKQFAALGEKPLEASIKLNESTGFLTQSLYQQIKALEEQGKHTEAAKVAQTAYSDTLDQNTAIITANLGHIERGWLAIVSAGKAALDSIKNVGRDAGPEQQLAKLSAEIARKEAMRDAPMALTREKEEAKRDLKLLNDQYAKLSKQVSLAQIRVVDNGIASQQLQDQIAFDKEHEKYMTNAVKLERELAKAAEMYSRVSHDGKLGEQNKKAYDDAVAKLKDQYKEKAAPKPKAEKVEGFGKELSETKEWLATQERTLKDSYSTQQKDLEDSFKSQEITAAQYYARQLESDAESLQQREQLRAEAQARFDAEIANRVAVTQARPESKAKSTALKDLRTEAENFAAAQDAARQKDINSMAKHSNAMAREIDKESKKVTGSVDAYIADMQRKAEADAKLLAAREAMAGQAPEIIAGMEAELKVRADAAKVLDQTAEAYALAAKNAREYEDELQSQYDSGKEVTAGQIRILEELKSAAVDSRLALLKLGGAVDTSALDASITATAASIKKQTDEVAKEVQKTLVDGIMSAGKDGGAGLRKALEDVLITKPFRIVIEAMLQPVSSAIAQGIMGQSIGGVAGATGFQTALNTASLAVSNFGSTALEAAKAVTLEGVSFAENASTIKALFSAGNYGQAAAGAIGTAFPAVAAAVAAKAIFDSMQGSVTPTGTFLYGGQGRFGGRQDFAQSGGLFGGGDTKNSSWFDPAPEVAKYMGAVEDVVLTSVKGWAQAIGLSADAVDSYSKQVEVSIGGLDSKGVQEAIGKAFAGMADDIAQTKFGDFLLPLAKSGETLGATLQRLGTDLLTVNNILRDLNKPLFDATTKGVQDMEAFLSSLGGLEKFTQLANTLTTVNSVLAGFNKALFDTSVDGAQAAKALVDSVGGLDRFNALASNLESVNNVLMDLGQSTFDLSVEGAEAAAALSRSVGGTDKLTKLASELLHVNENLAKLGEPLLDISVASAQAAHGMLKATDMAVEAKEAAERLEASYASFVSNLSNADTSSVSSLQAAFNKAFAAVTVSIPSIKGVGDLTSVTQEQYSSYTDPQRGKLDAAASAYKSLQTAIDAAAKSAESAAKTAKDAADAAVKAYSDALKAIEKDTRNVNRELADFGKTDFQKKLSKIGYDSQDKLAELDELSAKAADLSAAATSASLKATDATLGAVSTMTDGLIAASQDLSADSQEVANNIKDTLANSTAALGDALTLAPAISSLFDSILAGLLKIPPALTLVSGAVTGVGSAASNASGGLTAFGAAAGMAGSAATSATGPITSAGAAFNAVAPGAAAAGASLNALGGAFNTASAALTGLAGTFGAASAAVDGLNAAFASAASGLGGLTSALSSASGAGASLAGSLGGVSGALSAISGAAANAAGSISAAANALSAAGAASAPTPQLPSTPSTAPFMFADGGYIRGAGTTTSDSIPAMLSDKEFVVRASSVEKYGVGFLDALNAGVLPKTVYRAIGDPPSGAVTSLTDAKKQVVYLDTFSTFLTRFGGVLQTLDVTGKELTKAVVKLPESYTDALGTLKGVTGGKDFTGMDSASVSKFFLNLMANNAPTYNDETKTWSLSPEAQAALAPFANAGASIDTLLSGLKEREGWQDKLDVLTGKTTERELALKNDLASTTDETTQKLIRQVYAQEDLNKAREEEAKALASVQDALKNLQKESYSLEADLNSAFGTSAGDSAAKTIRKDLALADVRKTVADAGLLQSSPTYAAMSEAEKLKTNAAIQGIRDTALLAEKQYDLNEARKEEIKLLGDAKSRLKSLTDSGASKQVDRMRLLGDDAGADSMQEAIDLADVYKSTADATALLATEGLTPLDKAAIQATITTNDASIAQYARNKAIDAEIEILGRYKSAKEEADATNIELMKAMGNTAGAFAIELSKATKGFNDAQIATYRQTQATKGLIAAYGNLSNTADMVTNSRIGLLTAKGDTTGAAALQREFDIAPYVKAIAEANSQLSTATTQLEKDSLNSTIALNKGAIGNYDLSKSLDKEAQSATDAKAAADGLAQAYADMQSQIEQAKVALLRASGESNAADELEFAIATREREGDVYYASLYRELVTLRKLTEARQQLNTLEDSALQNQIKLKRANGEGVLANAIERSAFLKNASLPAAQAKAEIDRSNLSFASLLQSRGLAISGNDSFGLAGLAGDLSPEDRRIKSAYYDERTGTPGNQLNMLLREFASMGRTTDQKASLQSVIDTSSKIAAAYDRNKALEAELKLIELQDEAYKQSLDAQKAVADAQKSYADVLKSTIETMRDFIATLDGGASPLQNLSTARAIFQTVAGKAAAGDTSAYKDLTPAALTFLDLSKNYSRSIQDYQRDEARVRATLNAVIQVNQSELDKLPAELSKAADPLKDAWEALQKATLKETNATILLTALNVDQAASKRRLRSAEETLTDRYLETILALPNAGYLKDIFDKSVKNKVDETVLPNYSEVFSLRGIWEEKIGAAVPLIPGMSSAEFNALISGKFPGLEKLDFHVPLTPSQLAELLNGKFPTLTAANLVGVPADMVSLVNEQLKGVFPSDFAGGRFDAKEMMQAAIDKVMAGIAITTSTEVKPPGMSSAEFSALISGKFPGLEKLDFHVPLTPSQLAELLNGKFPTLTAANLVGVPADMVSLVNEQLEGVFPSDFASSAEFSALISGKFPGLEKLDFHVPLTPSQLADLLRGKFPTLTKDNLVSVPANMVELVNAELGKVFTPNFAGRPFDAQQMMQDAINRVMAAAVKPNVAADTATTVVNKVQEQAMTGGASGTGTSVGTSSGWSGTGMSPKEIVAKYSVGSSVTDWFVRTAPEYIAGLFGSNVETIQDATKFTAMVKKYGDNPALMDFMKSTGVDMAYWMGNAGIWGKYKGFPGFAVGTNYVPQDMIAQIHEGEAIIPAPFNPERYGKASGNDALVAEIKALRAQVESLQKSTEAGQNAIAANTRKTAQTLVKFDADGLPETRT